MYVAVKGGEQAIENAHRLLADRRRGARDIPDIRCEQISQQMSIGVARVMAEGSLYDAALASLAIKQAQGDFIEAVFLLRAFRNTLSRFAFTRPIDTSDMLIERRVSATYKDLPGGQVLGPTYDYTHRLLDATLLHDNNVAAPAIADDGLAPMVRVADILAGEDLIESSSANGEDQEPSDITRDTLDYPLTREARLQALARADEGFLLAMAYSTQRGFGRNHPFAGEIRVGLVAVEVNVPELGFTFSLGRIRVTECQMINQFIGSSAAGPRFTRGYGLVFGHSERKAMSMALIDRALRAGELGEDCSAPAQDEEFVISHCDNVQATGFVEHLKLPHYVDFQAELELIRKLKKDFEQSRRNRDKGSSERREQDALSESEA